MLKVVRPPLFAAGSQANPALSGLHLVTRRRAAGVPDPAGGQGGLFWIKTPQMQSARQFYVDFVADGGGYDFAAISNGRSGYRVTDALYDEYGRVMNGNSGAAGMGLDLFYPRSKDHWYAISNYVETFFGQSGLYYYLRTAGAVHGINDGDMVLTDPSFIMRDNNTYCSGAAEWKVPDGGPWWLRDSLYTEPNGDYYAGCYLRLDAYGAQGLQPNGLTFNDASCTYSPETHFVVSTNVKKHPLPVPAVELRLGSSYAIGGSCT